MPDQDISRWSVSLNAVRTELFWGSESKFQILKDIPESCVEKEEQSKEQSKESILPQKSLSFVEQVFNEPV